MSASKKPPTETKTPTAGVLDLVNPKTLKQKGPLWIVGAVIAVVGGLLFAVAEYWGDEMDRFDVLQVAMKDAGVENPKELPIGYAYASAIIHIAETLLKKPGGFLSNDMFPPGVLEDNMPQWEYGALTSLRDGTSALRNHIARAQTQSKEDADLAKAEPMFYFDHKSWQLPSSEGEYSKGMEAMERYRARLRKKVPAGTPLGDTSNEAPFFSRADNLRQYLEILEKRLGSLSNRLSASAGDARQLSQEDGRVQVSKTSWWNIDDIFFEARGYCWATIHILRAVEFDFRDILGNKTALVSLQAIIHELEDGQAPFLSPVILNGGGFGLFANYSLTLANYIARANAATIDLRNLLQQG
jgi:hypothetical protein